MMISKDIVVNSIKINIVTIYQQKHIQWCLNVYY